MLYMVHAMGTRYCMALSWPLHGLRPPCTLSMAGNAAPHICAPCLQTRCRCQAFTKLLGLKLANPEDLDPEVLKNPPYEPYTGAQLLMHQLHQGEPHEVQQLWGLSRYKRWPVKLCAHRACTIPLRAQCLCQR